jgi:hypothetical protein
VGDNILLQVPEPAITKHLLINGEVCDEKVQDAGGDITHDIQLRAPHYGIS